MGVLSIGGLVSGIDTDTMLSKLEAVSRTPITNLQNKKTLLQNKTAAWNEANTRILAVQTAAENLSNISNKVIKSALPSDSSVVVVAGSEAVAGNYAFKVNSVTKYNQVITHTGMDDQDLTSVGSGTVTITSNGKTKEIDASGMSLTTLKDSINTSDAGVSAYIIKDGSSKYRLVMTSSTAGTDGSITVGGTLGYGTTNAMDVLQAATDASITFGADGANPVTITRNTNVLSDIIPGLSMTISDASIGKTISVNVTQSNQMITQAISSFVDQYNSLNSFVKQMNVFDPKTGNTGLLFGEYKLQSTVNDIASAITTSISGLSSTMNNGTQAGLSFNSTGTLVFDSSKLSEAIPSNQDAVFQLFSSWGTSAKSELSYSGSTSDTKVSGTSGYNVQLSKAATRTALTISSQALPTDGLLQDETLSINGTSILLKSGYTATDIINTINAKTSTSNIIAQLTGADGTGTGNYLTFTHKNFGSGQSVYINSSLASSVEGSTGIGTTLLTETMTNGNLGTAGVDVVGTINGEAATGLGQLLNSTSGTSKGLKISINSADNNFSGSMVFTKGIGTILGEALSFITESDGGIKSTTDSINQQMTSIDEEISRIDASVITEMARLRSQFNAMETSLNTLKNQGTRLAGLISGLSTTSTSSG